jgi:type VII secretion protein EccE
MAWRGRARAAGDRQNVCWSGIDAAIADAPMKAQRRLGLALRWPWMTSAFLTDVAVLAQVSHLPVAASQPVVWWVGVAVAVVVTIAFVVTYRRITVAPALAKWAWGWSAPEMFDSSAGPEATPSAGCTPAIDHRRRFGRDAVGVREYQGQLVAVIAVDVAADVPSGRHQRQKVSSATLPVAAVAAG